MRGVLALAANGVSNDCSGTAGASNDENPYPDGSKQIAWNELGKDTVRSKLKDPESAEFRNVRFYSGGPAPTTCGEINANNGFGASPAMKGSSRLVGYGCFRE